MKEFIRKWLGIDEILSYSKQNKDQFEAIRLFYYQIEDKLIEISEVEFEKNFEKLEDNTLRVNQMLLELKGVVATTRALLKDSGKKNPKKSIKAKSK